MRLKMYPIRWGGCEPLMRVFVCLFGCARGGWGSHNPNWFSISCLWSRRCCLYAPVCVCTWVPACLLPLGLLGGIARRGRPGLRWWNCSGAARPTGRNEISAASTTAQWTRSQPHSSRERFRVHDITFQHEDEKCAHGKNLFREGKH